MADTEKERINKFLAEWIVGETLLWKDVPDYFTWEGFGLIWNKAKESEEWESFADNPNVSIFDDRGNEFIDTCLINPEVFPAEWAKFLEGKIPKKAQTK